MPSCGCGPNPCERWVGRATSSVKQLPVNPKHWEGDDWKPYHRYKNGVMAMTGSASMGTHMKKAPAGHRLQPGNLLVQDGSPGHAVMVPDAAVNALGERVVLIGQSYMAARQFHIIRNVNGLLPSAWYAAGDMVRSGIQTAS